MNFETVLIVNPVSAARKIKVRSLGSDSYEVSWVHPLSGESAQFRYHVELLQVIHVTSGPREIEVVGRAPALPALHSNSTSAVFSGVENNPPHWWLGFRIVTYIEGFTEEQGYVIIEELATIEEPIVPMWKRIIEAVKKVSKKVFGVFRRQKP